METQSREERSIGQKMNFLTPFFANLAAVLVYGAFHSLLASATVKRWARKAMGAFTDRIYRIIFNIIGFITFLPVIWVLGMWLGDTLYAWTGVWRLIPLTLQPVLLLLFVVAALQTQLLSFTGLRQLLGGVEPGGLRTTGVYSVVRHPLYSLGLGILWLFPIMTAGFLGFVCGVTIYILIGSTLEERRLIDEFGADYLAYQKRVKKLIPFIY
jgi:methanethiol S-methyltransferase